MGIVIQLLCKKTITLFSIATHTIIYNLLFAWVDTSTSYNSIRKVLLIFPCYLCLVSILKFFLFNLFHRYGIPYRLLCSFLVHLFILLKCIYNFIRTVTRESDPCNKKIYKNYRWINDLSLRFYRVLLASWNQKKTNFVLFKEYSSFHDRNCISNRAFKLLVIERYYNYEVVHDNTKNLRDLQLVSILLFVKVRFFF